MTTVLALQPDARQIGYAIFEGATLIDWGSKELGSGSLRCRITDIAIPCIRQLFKNLKPDVIVLPNPTKLAATARNRFLRAIRHEIEQHSCTIASISRHDIREDFKYVLKAEKPNKYSIMELLVRWFPELQPSLPKPRRRWESQDYWTPMFDAVALAVTYLHRND